MCVLANTGPGGVFQNFWLADSRYLVYRSMIDLSIASATRHLTSPGAHGALAFAATSKVFSSI
jgi:hypothetical protein